MVQAARAQIKVLKVQVRLKMFEKYIIKGLSEVSDLDLTLVLKLDLDMVKMAHVGVK